MYSSFHPNAEKQNQRTAATNSTPRKYFSLFLHWLKLPEGVQAESSELSMFPAESYDAESRVLI